MHLNPRSLLAYMVDSNILVMMNFRDISDGSFKSFNDSLPDDAKLIFQSAGYIGSLEDNIRKMGKKSAKIFFLLRSPDFHGLATDYFSSTPGSALIGIPDKLVVKIRMKQQDTDLSTGALAKNQFTGTIDQMVKKYNCLSLEDPRALLLQWLESENLRKSFTRKGLCTLYKTRIVPTYVAVGLETDDSKYLIGTTGARGPYIGTLKK
jgi:hypothetical protein